MNRPKFGTDGVRGVANRELTAEFALALGRAAGEALASGGETRPVVIARDPRRSGSMLGAALAAGFGSAGFDVRTMGVAPTPAVSHAVRTGAYGLGAVISASHNPAEDNGIKFFGPDGRKLPDAAERDLERRMAEEDGALVEAARIGRITPGPQEVASYIESLMEIVPDGLSGMRVAVDAANGAASAIVGPLLERLGATVVLSHADGDGDRINVESGATHPETIQRLTVESGANIGVAFDGDADRAIFADAKGRLVNGDRTIAIWAAQRKAEARLDPPLVVGTVMSNGGFEAHLEKVGVTLLRTPVGDKFVGSKMDETHALVGGEQSGHIIFAERGPTGDGLATALELFGALRRAGRTLDSFFDDYEPWPQLLVNVAVADRTTWNDGEIVQCALAQAERDLVGRGRINVRASGTQPMVRVMVEADDVELRDFVAAAVVGAIAREAGGVVRGRVDLTHSLGE